MNYALIKNARVENIIVASADFAAAIADDWDAVVLLSGDAGIGWGWDGKAFIQPEPQEKPAPVFAPQTCTPAQGLVALYALKGITEQQLIATLNAIEDEAMRYTALIGFNRATEWRRESPTMQAMAQLLQLSEADLDNLYAYSATVNV